MNQSCLLSGFSQASYREGPEFAGRFQGSMKPMTTWNQRIALLCVGSSLL